MLALAAVASTAFAAPANGIVENVTFSVTGEKQATDEDGELIDGVYILPSVDATINVKMAGLDTDVMDAGNWKPAAMVITGRGFAVGQEMVMLDGKAPDFTLSLTKANWGNPFMGEYYASLIVCFVNDEQDFYTYEVEEDGYTYEEPLMYEISYTTPNVFPANLLYTSPDGQWEYETFAEAYENEYIHFVFDNVVGFQNNNTAVRVVYTLIDDDEVINNYSFNPNYDYTADDAEPQNVMTEWDYMDGNYIVAVKIIDENLVPSDIESITVTLRNVTGMETVRNISKVLENEDADNSPQKSKKNSNAAGITFNNASIEFPCGNIYNAQGVLVRENASNVEGLKPGLYIVNGNKFVVR